MCVAIASKEYRIGLICEEGIYYLNEMLWARMYEGILHC
jgi:hypothetical protein